MPLSQKSSEKKAYFKHIFTILLLVSFFIAPLFSTPLMVVGSPYDFNHEDYEFIQGHIDIDEEKIDKINLPFVENVGQFESDWIRYSANIFAGSVGISNYGLEYSIETGEAEDDLSFLFFSERFVDASGETILVEPFGEDESLAKVSYFQGSDPGKWQKNLAAYNRINFNEVWDNIYVKTRAYRNNVEKLFYVKPGADPSAINIAIEPAVELGVSESGELAFTLSGKQFVFSKPIAYQLNELGEKDMVEVSYRLSQNVYGFQVGDYDPTRELVIDPELSSTFFFVNSITQLPLDMVVTSAGVFFTANTRSTTYPTTLGAWDETHNGNNDVYVTRLSLDLTNLIASTYIGGSGHDYGRAVVVDGAGDVFVTGYTASTNFPVTDGSSKTGPNDAYIAKLPADLSNLTVSKYIGGSGQNQGWDLYLNASNEVYMSGHTESSDFPIVGDVYDTTYNGNGDFFIMKFPNNLSSISLSTYFGGTDGYIMGNQTLAGDASGNIFLVGSTASTNFPGIGYDNTHNGGTDVIIGKFDAGLQNLLASTYLGGAGDEVPGWIRSMVIDPSGNVFVAGTTTGAASFPTTAGAPYESISENPVFFVSKLTNDLLTLSSSTFFPGAKGYNGDLYTIAVDSSGNVFLGGYTTNEYPDQLAFPLTEGSYYNVRLRAQPFILKFNNTLSAILTGTHIPSNGSNWDVVQLLSIEPGTDHVFVLMVYPSPDVMAAPGAWDETYGANKIYLLELDNNLSATVGNVAPDVPSSVGPSALINGSTTNDTTPTFTFNLTDDNLSDIVRYRIQISTSVAYEWFDIDYISEYQAQGAASYTVGQSAGTQGYYYDGSAGSSLSNLTNYYWRIRAIDYHSESNWYTANGGAVAFYVDTSFSGNNIPFAPSSLGPTNLVDGSWISNNTPGFTFSLSDPDGADTVKYRIQIDSDSGFAAPIVDYTSDLGAQGDFAFTLGQPEGGGAYTSGSEGQALADSNEYYWRVKAIDNSGAESAYTTANSGNIAFKVDSTPPTAGTLSLAVQETNSLKIEISGASDGLSGLAPLPYLFFETVTQESSGYTADVFWEHAGLNPDTQYVYQAGVRDVAGNVATTTDLIVNTLASITPPTPTGGGSLPPEAYDQPEGPFSLIINNNNPETPSSIVSLALQAGSNVARMAISNIFDLYDAVLEDYTDSKSWDLCKGWGQALPTNCDDGLKTVYVKFYTQYGVSSPVYSDSIYLNAHSTPTIIVDPQPTPPAPPAPPVAIGPPPVLPSPPALDIPPVQESPRPTEEDLSPGPPFDTPRSDARDRVLEKKPAKVLDRNDILECERINRKEIRQRYREEIRQINQRFIEAIKIARESRKQVMDEVKEIRKLTAQSKDKEMKKRAGELTKDKILDANALFKAGRMEALRIRKAERAAAKEARKHALAKVSELCLEHIMEDVVDAPAPPEEPIIDDVLPETPEPEEPPVQEETGEPFVPEEDVMEGDRDEVEDEIVITPVPEGVLGGIQKFAEVVSDAMIEAGEAMMDLSTEINLGIPYVYFTHTPPSVQDAADDPQESAQDLIEIVPGGEKIVAVAPAITATLLAPTITMLQYPVITQAMTSVFSFADLWLLFGRLWGGLLSFFGFRKRRNYWGTVYDSITKQPLDPVMVSLIDANTGAVKDRSITDLWGMYGFLAEPGIYVLRAEKSHYHYPSQRISGTKDGIFENIYHGEPIELRSSTDTITPNIPMDPLAYDFNQEAKKQFVKIHPIREQIVSYVLSTVFWLGFIVSSIAFIAHPNWVNSTIIALYVGIIAIRFVLPKSRLWGRVFSRLTGLPLFGATLELVRPEQSQVVLGRAVSSADGKFFLKSKQGNYQLSVKLPQTGEALVEMEVAVGKNGVVNQDIKID